jgi:hypothetical protein
MDYDEFQAEAETSMRTLADALFKIGADIDECVDDTTTAGKLVHKACVQMQTAFEALTRHIKALTDADIIEEEEEEEDEEEEEAE